MPLAGMATQTHTPPVFRTWLSTSAGPSHQTDPKTNTMRVASGLAWILIGILVLAVAVLSLIVGPAPSNQTAYLQSLADHATAATLTFTLFAAADLLMVPALLGLYPMLAPAGKVATLIGTGLLALWAVQDLVLTEATSLALVTLARNYAAASTNARPAILAAAQYPLAVLPIATFLSYVVSSVGLLLIGVAMLRSTFPHGIALLAIIAAAEGIAGGLYILTPALSALLMPSLVTFGLWGLLLGSNLIRHRTAQTLQRATTPMP